jgi:sugar lactone lactonase YvrE
MKKIITSIAITFYLTTHAQIITTVAGDGANGSGTGTFTGDHNQATTAGLSYPANVAFDAAGNMYICDGGNNRIREVSTAGIITTIAGSGAIGPQNGSYSGDGGAATSATLQYPYGVALDVVGNLYITDSQNNRIRKVTKSTGVITTVAGGGSNGSGDGGQATAAILNSPSGNVIFDAMGNYYIADGSAVRMVNTSGVISSVAGSSILATGYSGDGGTATAAQLKTSAIAFDAVGNLYIAEQLNNRVRMVTKSTGIINTIAGSGATGPFQGSYTGDGGQATDATLSGPGGITFDAIGNLYIADMWNDVIRKVTIATGIITTVAGGGTHGVADGGAPTAAGIDQPTGVAFDAAGNFYIADNLGYRMRKVTNIGAVGIEQFGNNNEINIYPNPSNGNFIIETTYTDKQTLQLVDVNGKLVLTQTINGKTNIDASNLTEGVYNLSLTNSSGVVNKRLVIVR